VESIHTDLQADNCGWSAKPSESFLRRKSFYDTLLNAAITSFSV